MGLGGTEWKRQGLEALNPALRPGKILRDLDVRSGGAVVLKLCNRSRGAGVVVASRRSGNGGRPSWRSKRQFHSF